MRSFYDGYDYVPSPSVCPHFPRSLRFRMTSLLIVIVSDAVVELISVIGLYAGYSIKQKYGSWRRPLEPIRQMRRPQIET